MALFGRLALVTGGASGIGKCTCQALALEGASIVVADINLERAIQAAKNLPGLQRHHAVKVDVGTSGSVEALFKEVKRLSTVPASILVNCAGISPLQTKTANNSEEVFDELIRVNLKGTFLMTKAAAREMISSGVADGAIVNISSILAKTGSLGQAGLYAATKAGVMGLTKSVAQKLASNGIRCNAVLPGLTDTPMVAVASDDMKSDVIAATPLGRQGRPEEIAEVIKFLCMPGSSFMTGAMVEVTGGHAM